MHEGTLSLPSAATPIEEQQKNRYPGLRVRRDGDAIVVHIPMRFQRRNGRSMVLPEGAATLVSAAQHLDDMSRVNRPLVEAIAKAHRWQAQLESGEYASLEDLAKDVGCDRTYVGRILHLTSLAPDIVEAILHGDEPDGISLEKLRKNLPVRWKEQRERWQNGSALNGGRALDRSRFTRTVPPGRSVPVRGYTAAVWPSTGKPRR